MELESEKNKELAEKQTISLVFEGERNLQKKELMDYEHKLKMERLEKRLEIAKITGKDTDD